MGYLSFRQSLIANAERHERRAAMHSSSGKAEWAKGSLKKAAKNRLLASEFEMDEIFSVAAASIARRVADKILYGSE